MEHAREIIGNITKCQDSNMKKIEEDFTALYAKCNKCVEKLNLFLKRGEDTFSISNIEALANEKMNQIKVIEERLSIMLEDFEKIMESEKMKELKKQKLSSIASLIGKRAEIKHIRNHYEKEFDELKNMPNYDAENDKLELGIKEVEAQVKEIKSIMSSEEYTRKKIKNAELTELLKNKLIELDKMEGQKAAEDMKIENDPNTLASLKKRIEAIEENLKSQTLLTAEMKNKKKNGQPILPK